MNFVVLDLEWNQAMSADSPVFNHLPIHLSGEIIEIGAVRLNEDMTLGEEFTIDVRPVYFRKMHYKVKKLTGFDKDRLANGVSFPEAFEKFREFCGDNVTFLTWGADDKRIFEQNIIIHDLDWDWIDDWINLQLIYNVQTGGNRNQKSLADGMEHFGIEQTRTAHDALGDAYNTALICTFLDMREGLRNYADANRILAARMPQSTTESDSRTGPEPIIHDCYPGFESKAAAFADERICKLVCPECGNPITGLKWINQGDGRYMNLYKCTAHGQLLARVRFKKDEETNTLTATRIVYEADDEMMQLYKDKAAQKKKRGRTHRSNRHRNIAR